MVIPCLNEASTIAGCITTAMAAMEAHGIVGEVVVWDNGSTDDSISIARAAGARVVSCAAKGYGAALTVGFQQARGNTDHGTPISLTTSA